MACSALHTLHESWWTRAWAPTLSSLVALLPALNAAAPTRPPPPPRAANDVYRKNAWVAVYELKRSPTAEAEDQRATARAAAWRTLRRGVGKVGVGWGALVCGAEVG